MVGFLTGLRQGIPSRTVRPGQFTELSRHDFDPRSEEHTSELQSPCNLVCRLLLEKKKGDLSRAQGVEMEVHSIEIEGPLEAGPLSETESRRRVFLCQPTSTSDESACAKKSLATLARRAYRRPVDAADVQALLRYYDEGRA